MSKSFYQIMIDGEPLIWNVDGECIWRDRKRVLDAVEDVQTYTNPRHIRVWHFETNEILGPYTKPTVDDVTEEIAVAIANARMAADGHCVEPDTRPEGFFGTFAAFHVDDYCDELLAEAQAERAEAKVAAE